MRIEDLRSETIQDRARVVATVIWEDYDQEPQELFYETTQEFADDLTCDPHAFLVACILPAMHFREQRILINEAICSELLIGLATNMRWYEYWSGNRLHPLQIDCVRGRNDRSLPSRKYAGSFLSGGLDSLATLRANHLNFSLDHGASIHDCIVVHGFDIGGTIEAGREQSYFDRSIAALHEVARDAEVDLIPIVTNVRLLHDDVGFWMHYFHGAALASVAHTLGRRLARVSIASSLLSSPVPWGSHPLVDPNYGSYDLQIRHDGLWLTRLEKARIVGDWEVALRNLRVCTHNPERGLNCGVCEKCVRTMLELLAVGKLGDATSFPAPVISLEALDALEIREDYEATLYNELLGPLAALGHRHIVDCLEAKLSDYQRHKAWVTEEDWKGVVKRIDRMWLRGGLYRFWAALRPRILSIKRRRSRH